MSLDSMRTDNPKRSNENRDADSEGNLSKSDSKPAKKLKATTDATRERTDKEQDMEIDSVDRSTQTHSEFGEAAYYGTPLQ